MTQDRWTEVDDYLNDLFAPRDPALDAALRSHADAGLPAIHVVPYQGKLLQVLARAVGARSILEIGTLGGYSTIWLARAMPPSGRLITLEANPKHAAVAVENIARAGLADAVEVRVGPAVESLAKIAAEGTPPFDLVFIDADKPSYPAYLEWTLRLTRPGSLIIADNIVREGGVLDPDHADERVRGARIFNAALAANPRLSASGVQTVSGKGYDGFAVAVVLQ